MEWYEIIAMCFAILTIIFLVLFLFYTTYRDYNLKEKKLEFEKKKYNELELDLKMLYSELHEINEKIKE